MTGGRALLQRIPDELDAAKAVRYEPDGNFDDVGDEDLGRAARWLRAASWSCMEGAKKLERIARARAEAPKPKLRRSTPAETPAEDKVVDLMGALEASVVAAREARARQDGEE